MSYHGRHGRDHTPAPDPIDDLLVDDTLKDTVDDPDPECSGEPADVTEAT